MPEKEPNQGTPEEMSEAEEVMDVHQRDASELREFQYELLTDAEKEALKSSTLRYEMVDIGHGEMIQIMAGSIKGHELLIFSVGGMPVAHVDGITVDPESAQQLARRYRRFAEMGKAPFDPDVLEKKRDKALKDLLGEQN